MAEPVKPRPYNSPRRREQAAATRREILLAAQRLFERQGFAATTMAAVADEAGVALKTVYLAFDTKAGLLRALWNFLLRGDEEDVPIAQREWYLEVLAEPDPRRKLELGARNGRLNKTRMGNLIEVIRAAAPTDPATGALWRRIHSDFHANLRRVVETLYESGALRPELDVDKATDLLWAINFSNVWHLLVGERGWPPEEYERWVYETSCFALLKT